MSGRRERERDILLRLRELELLGHVVCESKCELEEGKRETKIKLAVFGLRYYLSMGQCLQWKVDVICITHMD